MTWSFWPVRTRPITGQHGPAGQTGQHMYDDSQASISTAEEQLLFYGACDVCLLDCNGFLSISVITFIYLHGCTPPFCRLTSELSQPQKFTWNADVLPIFLPDPLALDQWWLEFRIQGGVWWRRCVLRRSLLYKISCQLISTASNSISVSRTTTVR